MIFGLLQKESSVITKNQVCLIDTMNQSNMKYPLTEQLEVVESTVHPDPQWDTFLNSIPGAEFEQSSLWAVVKMQDGWKPFRFIFRTGEKIIGGYQILIKEKKSLGRFGYAIKGPTYLHDYQDIAENIAQHLLDAANRLQCKFLIVQPPFIAPEIERYFERSGFAHERLLKIIQSSVVIDLENITSDDIFAELKPKRRQNIKKAQKSGLIFSEGSYTDLQCFFDLMITTCNRIGVTPNPRTINKLESIWEQFGSRDMIKMFFIESDGEKLCGITTILFGKKVYLWKFGWSGKKAKLHPNEYLYWKIIEWSVNNGYVSADFMDASGTIFPQKYKTCSIIPVNSVSGNSAIKTSFGGNITLFPKVRIVFFNRIYHLIYLIISLLGKVFPQLIKILKKRAIV